jgi:hypothetical protein
MNWSNKSLLIDQLGLNDAQTRLSNGSIATLSKLNRSICQMEFAFSFTMNLQGLISQRIAFPRACPMTSLSRPQYNSETK